MEIIRDHEGAPRGVYTGAIGTLGPDGDATFSVAIRTAVVDEATKIAEYGVGGGITHDSTEVGELTECVVKTDILTAHWPRFSLFETLRYDPGEGYFLLGRHLDRMAGSARYFGFPFDAGRAKGVLEETSGDAERTTRVRLMLDRTGHFVSEVQAWTESNSLSAVVSHIPVDSSDPFLYHKTTHRAVYEAQFKRYRNVADMVVLVNERREVTECLVGNVALRQGGRWFTPPESSGLLRGTYRDELLLRGEIQERVLYPEDLATAESVSMINSIREWVPLELVQASGTAAAG
jgi:para-aminobenzoate synthetase/4-amino-4-deoxychorismate lyase